MIRTFTLTFFLLFLFKQTFSQTNHYQPLPLNSKEVIDEGIKLYNEDKFDEALVKFKQVSRSDTNYVWAKYETALTYHAKKQYDEAIKLCKEGIKLNTYHDLMFYNILGTAYDYKGDKEKALTTYDEALVKFPASFKLYFEKAGVYLNHKDYPEAVKNYQKAISLNFMHFGSHYNLGRIYAANGYTTQAALCFQTALLMESQSQRSVQCVLELEKAVTVFNTSGVDSIKSLNINREPFEEIELLLQSNAALQNSYELKTDVNYKCTRQVQLILEKLGSVQGNDFTFEYYVPFYKEIWKKNYFQPLSYFLIASIDKKANSIVNKPDSRSKEFVKWAIEELVKVRDLHFNKNGKTFSTEYYNDGQLAAVGELKNDKIVGPFTGYYSSGYLKSKGNFDEAGKKTGEWNYYYDNGALVRTVQHTSDVNYTYKIYYQDGTLKEEGTVKNEMYDGLIKVYSESGALQKAINASQDKFNGLYTSYYDFGTKRGEVNYVNGQQEGTYTNYFVNGVLKSKGEYKAGKEQGPYKEYYISGKLSAEGTMENDKLNGEWKWYHENGKLRKVGKYKNGVEDGLWVSYDESGKRIDESIFVNGSLENQKDFDNDKAYSEYVYSGNKLKSYTFFPKNITTVPTGKNQVTFYHLNGTKIKEGTVINGMLEGKWNQYNPKGILVAEVNYVKNSRENAYKTYHVNGTVKEEGNYKNGQLDGVCKTYFSNGTLESIGWYVEGAKQGEWRFYHLNGNLKSVVYFLDDENTGIIEHYHADGTLENESEENKYLQAYRTFDAKGNLFEEVKLKSGNGKMLLHHFNGKVMYDAVYKNGAKIGKTAVYFANGQLLRSDNYDYQDLHGESVIYSPEGLKADILNYKFGSIDSVSTSFDDFTGVKDYNCTYKNGLANGPVKWYNPDGSVSVEGQYKDGERDGYFTYYSEDGKLIKFKLKFNNDFIESYTYEDKNGQLIPEIPISKEKTTIKAYYRTGALSASINYEFGERNGLCTHYFPDGKIQEETSYFLGGKNGVQKSYYPNGNIKKERPYKNDLLHGEVKYFNEKGELVKSETYEMDQRHGKSDKVDGSGKVIKTVQFVYGEPVI